MAGEMADPSAEVEDQDGCNRRSVTLCVGLFCEGVVCLNSRIVTKDGGDATPLSAGGSAVGIGEVLGAHPSRRVDREDKRDSLGAWPMSRGALATAT
jgi:hypothetical protein